MPQLIDISAFDYLPSAVAVMKKESNLIFINKKFTELFGYNFDDISSIDKWNKIVVSMEDDNDNHSFSWSNTLLKLENSLNEIHIEKSLLICKDKQIKNIEFSLSYSGDKFIVCFQDITSSSQTSSQLKNKVLKDKDDTQLKYESLILGFPDIVLVYDYDEHLLFANPSFTTQTGLLLEDIKHKPKYSFIHPDDRALVIEKISDYISSDTNNPLTLEYRILDKKSQVQWHNGIVAKISFHDSPTIQLISRDISKSKRDQESIIESEKRMSAIFDSAPVSMILLNYKREILQINKKGLSSLKKPYKELNQRAFGSVYSCISALDSPQGCGFGKSCNKCQIRQALEDTFLTGKPHYKVEITLKTLDGIQVFFLSTNLLQYTNRKEILASIDDITQQKQIENQLKYTIDQATESERLKTAFLQNISHEIRTPLNGILGFSNLLGNDNLTEEEKCFYIETLNESSSQLLNVVDNVLNLSRMETEKLPVYKEEVKLNNLLNELYDIYNEQIINKDISLLLNKELDNISSIIYSDTNKLTLIFENLLNNAVKFTKSGKITFGYTIKADKIEFFVEDTGIGIEKIYWIKIFERFYQIDHNLTRAFGGTGLGLTIAKGNVDLLGGKIWVNSSLGNGSSFYFSLQYNPVIESDITYSEKEPAPLDSILPLILVAEDEEINYLFMEEALKEVKVSLLHAKNGRETVEICRERENICLVLMDIKMPLMNGFDAFSAIKKFRPNLPIVAQTAYASSSDKQKADELGFNNYLVKPIRKNLLVEMINNYINP